MSVGYSAKWSLATLYFTQDDYNSLKKKEKKEKKLTRQSTYLGDLVLRQVGCVGHGQLTELSLYRLILEVTPVEHGRVFGRLVQEQRLGHAGLRLKEEGGN